MNIVQRQENDEGEEDGATQDPHVGVKRRAGDQDGHEDNPQDGQEDVAAGVVIAIWYGDVRYWAAEVVVVAGDVEGATTDVAVVDGRRLGRDGWARRRGDVLLRHRNAEELREGEPAEGDEDDPIGRAVVAVVVPPGLAADEEEEQGHGDGGGADR